MHRRSRRPRQLLLRRLKRLLLVLYLLHPCSRDHRRSRRPASRDIPIILTIKKGVQCAPLKGRVFRS